jgi:hypothetical protein
MPRHSLRLADGIGVLRAEECLHALRCALPFISKFWMERDKVGLEA